MIQQHAGKFIGALFLGVFYTSVGLLVLEGVYVFYKSGAWSTGDPNESMMLSSYGFLLALQTPITWILILIALVSYFLLNLVQKKNPK